MPVRKGGSGSYLSDERRAELGHERLYLRPPAGTKAKLEKLARALGTSNAGALAWAVDCASRSLGRLLEELQEPPSK